MLSTTQPSQQPEPRRANLATAAELPTFPESMRHPGARLINIDPNYPDVTHVRVRLEDGSIHHYYYTEQQRQVHQLFVRDGCLPSEQYAPMMEQADVVAIPVR